VSKTIEIVIVPDLLNVKFWQFLDHSEKNLILLIYPHHLRISIFAGFYQGFFWTEALAFLGVINFL